MIVFMQETTCITRINEHSEVKWSNFNNNNGEEELVVSIVGIKTKT